MFTEQSPFRAVIWFASVLAVIGVLIGLRLLFLSLEPFPDDLTVSAPRRQPGAKLWGVSLNGFQINDKDDVFEPGKVDQMVALLEELGANAVFFPYEATTDNQPFDEVNDAMVSKFYEAGFTIVLSCCDGFVFDDQDRYQSAYEFAQRLGKKYSQKVQYFQFLNEVSGTAILPGRSGFTIEDYDHEKYLEIRELLHGLTAGVASVHPNAKRIVSAHWLGIGIIDQLIGDRVPFEVVAWHWFSDMGPDPVAVELSPERGVPAAYAGQTLHLPAHYTEQGKEFWITETNLQGGSFGSQEAEQAAYLRQMFAVARDTPEITGLFVYRLTDGAENAGTSAWGIYETRPSDDGQSLTFDHPKEAFRVYQEFLLTLAFDQPEVNQ